MFHELGLVRARDMSEANGSGHIIKRKKINNIKTI